MLLRFACLFVHAQELDEELVHLAKAQYYEQAAVA